MFLQQSAVRDPRCGTGRCTGTRAPMKLGRSCASNAMLAMPQRAPSGLSASQEAPGTHQCWPAREVSVGRGAEMVPQGFSPISLPCSHSFPLRSSLLLTWTCCHPLAVRPCPMPPKIRNGQHDGHGKTFFTTGMSVMYSCDPGYYLVGNAQVVCKTLGNWSQPMPRCEGASVWPP